VTAILLALLAAGTWGTSDFIGGRASQTRHVLGVMILTRPLGLVVIGAVAALGGGAFVADGWELAVLAAFVLFAGTYCLYLALSIGPMSVVAPVFTLSVAVPVLYGLVNGEEPSGLQLAGLAVAVVGSALAARAPSTEGERTDPRGIAFALAAAVGMGGGLALMDAAADHDAVAAVFVERGTEVVLVVLMVLARPRALVPHLRSPGLLPLAGTIDVSASLFFALATRQGLLPVVSVLASLYPVVTVLLARAFLAERLSRGQAAGAALTLVGVAVVAGSG
jgi:drug/metabolite transporter (DMT)-like permease